jgi:hypothetical protein
VELEYGVGLQRNEVVSEEVFIINKDFNKIEISYEIKINKNVGRFN